MILRRTAIALSILVCWACSSNRGDDDDSDSPPGSSGGSGSGALDLTEACEAGCALQIDCGLLVSLGACVSDCVSGGELFDEACRSLVAEESQCIAGLTCEELDEYAQGRSGHAKCGKAFDEFAGSCAINDGVPPPACDRFCARVNDCELPALPEQGCAENCLLTLTGETIAWGAECADVQAARYDCFSKQTCEELVALNSGNITPAACVHLDQELIVACR